MGLLKQFVDRLCLEVGIAEPLAPNADHSYSFFLDPDLQILIKENLQPEVVTFFTKLTQCPTKKLEDYYQKVMHANLLGIETGGGVLGLDRAGSIVTFSYLISGPTDYNEFRDSIEDFINYAEAWREDTIKFEIEAKL